MGKYAQNIHRCKCDGIRGLCDTCRSKTGLAPENGDEKPRASILPKGPNGNVSWHVQILGMQVNYNLRGILNLHPYSTCWCFTVHVDSFQVFGNIIHFPSLSAWVKLSLKVNKSWRVWGSKFQPPFWWRGLFFSRLSCLISMQVQNIWEISRKKHT